MKVPAALLSLALASAVVAQGTPELPSCAQQCANQFLVGGIGDCGSDVKCICANKDFLGSIACCLAGACDQASQDQAVQFALGLCQGVGVTDLPSSVACTTGSASTTAPASESTSGSATGTETSPATTGTGSAASEATGASATSTTSSRNIGPRPTAAAAGLGAIGGIVAAVALL
jgi:hypothetical protein